VGGRRDLVEVVTGGIWRMVQHKVVFSLSIHVSLAGPASVGRRPVTDVPAARLVSRLNRRRGLHTVRRNKLPTA
jgi:hypothetical protein